MDQIISWWTKLDQIGLMDWTDIAIKSTCYMGFRAKTVQCIIKSGPV